MAKTAVYMSGSIKAEVTIQQHSSYVHFSLLE